MEDKRGKKQEGKAGKSAVAYIGSCLDLSLPALALVYRAVSPLHLLSWGQLAS